MKHPVLSLYQPLPGATKRLLCLPHAGGGASAFRAWRTALAAENIDLCAVQLPGRENRLSEPCLSSAAEIVDHIDQATEQLPPLPTALLGHSMGTLIGYLLALKWQREGKTAPIRYIASAGLSPSCRTEQRDTYTLPDADFKKKVFEHDGVPAQLREMPELLDIFLPILRADYGVFDRFIYTPDERLQCPVSVYAGESDAAVPLQQLHRWQEIAQGDIQVRHFSGGHFYLYQQVDTIKPLLLEDIA